MAATIADPTVDLRANKTGPSPQLAVVGQPYQYRLSASNDGNAAFFGTLILTDNLPSNVVVNSYGASPWSCLPVAPVTGPATITCTLDYTSGAPLGAGATTPLAIFNFETSAAGSITNSVTVASPNPNIPDTNSGSDTTSYTVTSEQPGDSADVFAFKSASLATLEVGEVQTFQIEMVNIGPSISTDVRLSDTLTSLINSLAGPTEAGYIGETIAPGVATGLSCTDFASGGTARQLNCTAASLPVCSQGVDCPVITVQIRPGGNAGTLGNTARVRSFGTPDPDLTNDSDSVSYDVTARADVTVSKSVTPDPANAGQDVTFVITAQNIANGLSAAENVTITDDLPDDLTFVSATPSTGSCSGVPSAGTVTSSDSFTCNLGTIPNGAQQTVTVVARPNNVLIGTTVTNNTDITTTTVETDPTNNDASIDFDLIDAEIDLLINKDDSVDPVVIGETTVYTLTVTNDGPSASENVVVTDVMPPSIFAYRSHTVPADGTCTTVPLVLPSPPVAAADRTLECSIPYLEDGESGSSRSPLKLSRKGPPERRVDIIRRDRRWLGPAVANNQTSETTTARTRADPEVTSKLPDTDPVNLRDPFDFVITVNNNVGAGLAEADDVFVTDTLPAGMFLTGPPSVTSGAGFVTSTSCTGVAGGSSFTCDLGTFDNGGVVEITVPVRVETHLRGPASPTPRRSPHRPSIPFRATTTTRAVSRSTCRRWPGTVYRDFNDSATPTVSGTGPARGYRRGGRDHDADRHRLRRCADHRKRSSRTPMATTSSPSCPKAPTRSPAARSANRTWPSGRTRPAAKAARSTARP